MKKQITNRFTGEVIFECDVPDGLSSGMALRHALEASIRAGANLSGATDAGLAVAKTRILPEGSLIGWKKCQNGVLVKLRIPEEAKRSHAFGRKCRAEFADVLEVIPKGSYKVAKSIHDGGKTVYKVGSRVYPDAFSTEWQDACAPGIHFFITREEAEDYS